MKKSEKVLYNIHDIIKLTSFVDLHELEYFASNGDGIKMDDIDMYVGSDINDVTYQDLLCSLEIESNKDIYLGVSPLISRSRHVLYVNLVEPLLRLLLVPIVYALLDL